MENSIVDFIQEVGYSFTSSIDECRNTLLSFSPNIKDQLNACNIARILGMMARTHNSLSTDWQQPQSQQQQQANTIDNAWNDTKDSSQQSSTPTPTSSSSSSSTGSLILTWNTDIFMQTLLELTPQMPWKDVVKEFDHPEFIIKDKQALKLIVQAIKRVIRDTSPIEYIYRTWKNSEGQLSWIIHSLKHPDIFCLADYPSKKTATECLKAQPEDDNKLIAPWRSLNLLEVLLNISDTGVYSSCIELFKFPITHCPDLLILGLLQLNVS